MSFRSAHLGVRRPLCIALAVAGIGATAAAFAADVSSPLIGARRVLLPSGTYRPGELGTTLLHDYGAFQLFRVDAARLAELNATSSKDVRIVADGIDFVAGSIDPAVTTAAAEIPDSLRRGRLSGPRLHVVQFAGPPAAEWLQALRATGAHELQYVANNAYVIWADDAAIARIEAEVERGGVLLFSGDYVPFYKVDEELLRRARAGFSRSTDLLVTVTLASHNGSAASKHRIEMLAKAPLGPWFDLDGFEGLRIHVSEADIAAIAQLPDVYAIEQYVPPRRMDERQGQIVAGNLNGTQSGPSAPGYLDFLAARGFPTDPAVYPIVSVVDDGVGDGTTGAGAGDRTLTRNGDGTTSRVVFARNCTTSVDAGGKDGHGHLNTNIVAGYDARVGFPYVDPLGYLRGLGMNPYGRVGNTKVFTEGGSLVISACGGTMAQIAKNQQDDGAIISTNSWGAAVSGAYNADARAYDIAVRDADSSEAGNQPMIFLFSAGNSGSGAQTIGSPGTAKNVITVGASENQRPSDEDGPWSDGCGIGSAGADNAMDVIAFSSRGPARTGRAKPEIIAPGTHIQATASPNPGYNGSGVCDFNRPSGQATFASSSGTSHSTPAMAGVASLAYWWLQNRLGDVTPSPAMMKAYLIAHATYLTGVSANDTLPSYAQGYGMPNLGAAFDGTPKIIVDQTTTFSDAGNTFTLSSAVSDPTKPLRIVLAYTDAPGATNAANPPINNLNLSVTAGGNTYLGNRFSGRWSTSGGTADAVNNYEAVFLPPGTTGPVIVTVAAATIAGDGVPDNTDTTDQDFALVCNNCSQTPDFSLDTNVHTQDVCAGTSATWNLKLTAQAGFSSPVGFAVSGLPAGASSSFAPANVTPNGSTTLTIDTAGVTTGYYPLTLTADDGTGHAHAAPAALAVTGGTPGASALASPANGGYGLALNPTLTWSAVADARSYVVEIDDDPSFGSVNYSAEIDQPTHTLRTGLAPNTRYYWRVRSRNVCGETHSNVRSFVTNALICQTFASTDVPKSIATTGTPTITSTLTSTITGNIGDVDVLNLTGTHTWISDLDFTLTSPSGKSIIVMNRSCTDQDNFGLNLDDAAAGFPGSWPCPPTGGGIYKPSNPLIGFANAPASGTWTLTVHDYFSGDGGALTAWGLRLCVQNAPDLAAPADDIYLGSEDIAISEPIPGVLGNDRPASGLTASMQMPPAHGGLTLNADGSFVYQPDPNFCGDDSFTYLAASASDSAPASVALQVGCINDAPTAANDSYQTFEDTPLSITAAGVLANDSDIDSPMLTAALATTTTHGTLTLGTDGHFDYTPNAGYCGGDSFSYVANDGSADSTPAIVQIDVQCVNDAPVAGCGFDRLRLVEGATVDIALGGMFVDPESQPLTLSGSGLPPNLGINNNGHLAGVVAPGASGGSLYAAQITATDGEGASLVRSLAIEVLTAGDRVFRGDFEDSNLLNTCH